MRLIREDRRSAAPVGEVALRPPRDPRQNDRVRSPSAWLLPLATVTALLVGACSSAEPAADTDRIVLNPPSDGAAHTHAPGQGDPATVGDGTSPSAGGYRLAGVRLPSGTDGPSELSFQVLGPDGEPVTDYTEQQTKLLHLYVVRTDYAVFRHLHPTMADDGTWSVPADLAEPGDYRVIADFLPADAEQPLVLGTESTVPGQWRPTPLSPGGDDGVVQVRVDGTGTVGPDGRLRLLVSTVDDEPVVLGSYLGAAAHVSGFRTGGQSIRDRVFVHVHPYGAPEQTEDATRLTFHTTFERAGDYRFFVQVRVDGFVHTVPVTATVAAG
jgi:hypothetical protein